MPLPLTLDPLARSNSASAALRSIAQLPGPRGWPVVGNLPQLRAAHIHRDMEALAAHHGALFKIRFGRRLVLVVADHALIETILRDRPDGFRRPAMTAQVSHEMGGRPGVFVVEGTIWRNQRRMVMAGLAPHAVKAYFPSLVTVAQRLQKRWVVAACAGQSIALNDDLKRYSVDIIAGLALGTASNTIEGIDDVIHQQMEVVMHAMARRSRSAVPYWRYFRLPADRRLDRSVAALRTTVTALIAAARQRLDDEPDRRAHPRNLLEAMICAADDPDSGVDQSAIAGNATTMLLAGEDTTANTIAWMIYLMQRHPATLQRARDEVLREIPDIAAVSVAQLDALDFLGACAQEAMRLKPVAPFMPLEALRTTTVGDVEVPAGTLVWCVMRHDSVSDRYFPRADIFDPDRWLQVGDGAANKSASMPFGAGPRTCPGRYLALLEIKLAVAMLLSSFDITALDTPDGADACEVMGFTMAPPALRMRIRSRVP